MRLSDKMYHMFLMLKNGAGDIIHCLEVLVLLEYTYNGTDTVPKDFIATSSNFLGLCK